ncbi:aspartate kinase [Alkalibacterium pelagium]|uniref:Aspartokinase n=1 Tax=Alkalibacterium pelagium TaxID=426702 RepID=A0A1H7JQT8_9LACT|nr:aspartate kinase [Alkalibacterium pelagium]GEN50571.1 aspartokinase [Alkalibacterium pelagium]SEK77021.1 aspartate kinase [Alkalibacterium pelagium]
MKRSVLKFGGSSVADFSKIKNIAQYLKERVEADEQLVVVVSAMGKTTDQLLASVNELTSKPNDKDLAMLLTTGEQQTISFLSLALNDLNVNAKPLTGYQAGIETIGKHLKSKISSIKTDLLEQLFKEQNILIVAGFQGFNKAGELTTLGRGGSDTTAVAIASALDCPCEIYTDVTGVFSTDPRVYPEAKRWDTISFEEMMEMSALGAGVLETRSVELANNHNIPIYLGKTLSNEKGTWIVPYDQMLERKAVTGVALDKEMAHVTITYPNESQSFLHDLFIKLEEAEINIDMISQIQNQDGLQLSFTFKESEERELNELFDSLKSDYDRLYVKIETTYCKVSVIGAGMRDMTGIASKIFKTLIESDIPFYQVTTSEISVSYVVDGENGEKATRILCQTFDL